MLLPAIFFFCTCVRERECPNTIEKRKKGLLHSAVASPNNGRNGWDAKTSAFVDAIWEWMHIGPLSLCSHLPTLLKRTYLETLPFYINGPTLSFFDRKVSYCKMHHRPNVLPKEKNYLCCGKSNTFSDCGHSSILLAYRINKVYVGKCVNMCFRALFGPITTELRTGLCRRVHELSKVQLARLLQLIVLWIFQRLRISIKKGPQFCHLLHFYRHFRQRINVSLFFELRAICPLMMLGYLTSTISPNGGGSSIKCVVHCVCDREGAECGCRLLCGCRR